MKFKDWINVLVILLLLGISFYRYKSKTYTASRIKFLMDTQVELSVVSRNPEVNQLLDEAFEMIEKYDAIFSYFNPNSLLYQINHSEIMPIRINQDFYTVLTIAEKLFYESNNLYDVSIAPLLDIWDFVNENIPAIEEIEIAQRRVGFDRIIYDEDFIFLPEEMKLNLGSLSKGYIVDKIIEYFIENEVEEAYVNAGGDIRFFSHNKKRWRIGVQHPRDNQSTIAVLRVPDIAVATSGDYERYFMIDGERYHHILNPKTGFPSFPTIAVTIFSSTAVLADALSTAAFVMSPFDAIELIKSYPETEGIIYFYDVDGQPLSLKTTDTRKWIISEVNEF